MMRMGKIAACCAALLLTGTSAAQAATNLQCMDLPYAAEDQRRIDDFIAHYPSSQGDLDRKKAVQLVLRDRALSCATGNGWTPAAADLAFLYAYSQTLAAGLKTYSPFSPDERTRVFAAIESADLQQLRSGVGPMLEAQIDGKPDVDVPRSAIDYLDAQLAKAGLRFADDQAKALEQGDYIGQLAAARVMRQIVTERFAKA